MEEIAHTFILFILHYTDGQRLKFMLITYKKKCRNNRNVFDHTFYLIFLYDCI